MTDRKTRKKKKTKGNRIRKNKTRGGKSKFLGWKKHANQVYKHKGKSTHYIYFCKYFYNNEDEKRMYEPYLIATYDPEFNCDDKSIAEELIKNKSDPEKRERLEKIQASKKNFEEWIQNRIKKILKEREEEAARKAGEETEFAELINKKKEEKANKPELEIPLVEDAINCDEHPDQCNNATRATDVINTNDIPMVDITTKKPSILSKLNPFAKKPNGPVSTEVPGIPIGVLERDTFHGVDINELEGDAERQRLLAHRLPKKI
jgi:hypothetical protein